jgi:4-amino-4-deoxy-L-arabinose transferase-like glycosyltransferase
MAQPVSRDVHLSRRSAVIACAALLLVFATLSYTAVLHKSAIYDEPGPAAAGYLVRTLGDYRIDPEEGALFLRWSALPHPAGALFVPVDDPNYSATLQDHERQWPLVVKMLYHPAELASPGDPPGLPLRRDADAYLNRSRLLFVLAGVALGVMIAIWSWQLTGRRGAVAATTLFALDPNFLGHAALVKTDVPAAVLMFAAAYAAWLLGRRGTWVRLAALALLVGAAVCVKFSGVLLGPILLALLFTRALLPRTWRLFGRECGTRAARLLAAVGVCAVVALVSYAVIWASYGFRFGPSPDPSVRFNTEQYLELAKLNQLRARSPDPEHDVPSPTDLAGYRPGLVVRVASGMIEHRALPSAWLHGFLYTYATTSVRPSFLMGDYSMTGWWYYFPLAMLFKTPLATLAAGIVACGVAACSGMKGRLTGRGRADLRDTSRANRRKRGGAAPRPKETPKSEPAVEAKDAAPARRLDAWACLCLLVPTGLYGLSALSSNVNLGLRHVLPLFPFLYTLIGAGFARMLADRRRNAAILAAVLAVGLAAETLAAYPDYVAFFNVAAGGSRGGLRLLSDSNLDWGQDLRLLADWQHRPEHRDRPLYLCYFGTADPAYYGIDRHELPGGWPFRAPEPGPPPVRCYLAVSATSLQGTYVSSPWREFYAFLRETRTPREVLGGTIYIYDWSPELLPTPPMQAPAKP